MEKATFGAGCFWGIEVAFRKVPGVSDVAVGYSGGDISSPSYEEVCTGNTGHAEVVEVDFDPATVSYDELLGVFWDVHDPTTLNKQGPDIGTQYRSAVFYHSPKQQEAAKISLDAQHASGKFRNPIVTEITPHNHFYRAEEYHQRYFEKQGRH